MFDSPSQNASRPGSSADPPPDNADGKAENVLLFTTDSHEFPKVIRYLNQGKFTGQLEIDSTDTPGKRGVISFRQGEVCYARQEGKEGVEAIRELAGADAVLGVFFPGDTLPAGNIDTPTRSLLEEMGLVAERMQQEGFSPDGSDVDGFSLGRRTVCRFVSRDHMRLAGAGNRFKRSGRSHLLAVTLALLALGALVINGVWLLGVVKDRTFRQAQARELAEQAENRAAMEKERKKKIADLLFEGGGALKNGDFQLAADKAEAVLAVDPGNKGALDLQERVTKKKNLTTLIPLSDEVARTQAKLNFLLEDPLFKEEAASLFRQQEQGALYFKYADYEKAIREFRAYLKGAETLLDRRRQYEAAKAARTSCGEARAQTVSLAEIKGGKDVFAEAVGKEKAALELFGKNQWQAAAKAWAEAGELFLEASRTAKETMRLQQARSEFEKTMDTVNEQILTTFLPVEMKKIQAKRHQALQLETTGDIRLAVEKWQETAKVLQMAWEQASREHAEAIYSERISVARKALQQEDWQKAVDALADVIAMDDFKQDAEVHALWKKASYENYLNQLSTLKKAEQWVELRGVAQKLLALKPDDPAGKEAIELAEDKLVPRIRFHLTRDGEVFTRCDIQVQGSDAVAESTLVYRLKPGGEYTFHLQLPPKDGIYFKPVTYSHTSSEPGLQLVTINVTPLSAPEIGLPWAVPGTTVKLAPLPGGSFIMGSDKRGDEQPPHKVRITRAFWMAETETTNEQFRQFIKEAAYDGTSDCRPGYLRHFSQKMDVPAGDVFPVVYISWTNAVAFCQWLTRREKEKNRLLEGYVYRLPTEAEWEYACKEGQIKAFNADPAVVAWYGRRSRNNARTGLLKPNRWGLYDIHGNVWELCRDWHAGYSADAQTDPVGPEKGLYKVLRGGSWRDSLEQIRPAWRNQITTSEPRNNVGFRIVLAPER